MGKIIALIPARSGSKRVPNKNFRILGGRQLVEWTITTCQAVEAIDEIWMTSDIDAGEAWERQYGLNFIRRPDELCSDDTGDHEVVMHALAMIDYSDLDLICYMRPTTPFRATYHIEQAIKVMRETDATGLRSVEEMAESAFKCFYKPEPGLYPIRYDDKNLSDFPNHLVIGTYKANGYIDIARPEIVASGRLWGDSVYGYITPRTIEIDTPEDWDYAQWFAQRQVTQIINFGKYAT